MLSSGLEVEEGVNGAGRRLEMGLDSLLEVSKRGPCEVLSLWLACEARDPFHFQQ